MDGKIEEMAKAIEYAINNDCKLNNGKSCEDCIFDNNGDWNCQNILVATHLFGEKYRKESDTARDVIGDLAELIINHSGRLNLEDLYEIAEKYGVKVG